MGVQTDGDTVIDIAPVGMVIHLLRLEAHVNHEGQGLAKATYETGFTLTVLLLVAAAAWNVYLFLQSRRISEAHRMAPDTVRTGNDHSPAQSESPPLPLESQGRICRHCAQPIRATARFCESCGRSAETTVGSPDEPQIPLK